MSPFPQELANAQRRALHAELVSAEENVATISKALRELDPHLAAMSREDFDELLQLVRAAGAALRRCEVLTT